MASGSAITPRRGALGGTGAALALAAATLAATPATAPAEEQVRITRLGSGSWTYFSDPRVVATPGAIYTGWISRAGRVVVAKFVPATGRHRQVTVGATGVDDHNNPSLLLRPDGRLMVFFSPHSGRVEPKGRVSRLYYRLARRPNSIASWGPTRHVPVNAPGRLGFTYPNPIALSGNRVWLSWRGGGWLPTFSILKAGRWSAAQEIVRGPRGSRPYAKYAGGPAGSDVVHVAFTEAHPVTQSTTTVRYLQYRRGLGFFSADGRRLATAATLPLPASRSELVHGYNAGSGRAWVMDVADDGQGRPVIVYSVGFGRSHQAFRYARWTGEQWLDRPITSAYTSVRRRETGAFQTGGIVLDHRDVSTVYLSRVVGSHAQVQEWHTPDGGITWTQVRRLSPAGHNCFRPAAPIAGTQRAVLFVCGRVRHWQRFATTIHVARD